MSFNPRPDTSGGLSPGCYPSSEAYSTSRVSLENDFSTEESFSEEGYAALEKRKEDIDQFFASVEMDLDDTLRRLRRVRREAATGAPHESDEIDEMIDHLSSSRRVVNDFRDSARVGYTRALNEYEEKLKELKKDNDI